MVKKFILSFVVLFMFIVSLSVVSAGFLGDVFSGKITGNVVSVNFETSGAWTTWLDRDNPSGAGDYEDINGFGAETICGGEQPLNIECRRKTDYMPWNLTGELVHATTKTGCWCVNAEQNGGYCSDYEVRFFCEEITNPQDGWGAPNYGEKVPKVSFWQGKVNQHYDMAKDIWFTDLDGVSGAELGATDALRINYCKKFYPHTVDVKYIGDELIGDRKDRGNLKSYSSTKPVYECLYEVQPECPSLDDNTYNSDVVVATEGDEMVYDGRDITLVRVGFDAAIIDVAGQTKVISKGDYEIFEDANDYKVSLVDVAYQEGCPENQAALIFEDTNVPVNCDLSDFPS
ncbi:hypothetical protein JXA48_04600 [Candidatus Woesearchaeota archaeon]|nr:hypothetical protein [Candidatus Woesearchaeota archaeon]